MADVGLCRLDRVIEGSNFLNLAQREFTFSFWVKGTKTGIHCVAFRNSGANRSYIGEYTINTTATWEYKTITVSASPTAGTWDYGTGAGLQISWALGVGTDYQTTAGTWQTGNFFGTSNQVNACDSTSNDFRVTGIRIEPGAFATPFVLPDYEQEMGRCGRYYQKSYTDGVFAGAISTVAAIIWQTRTAIAASTAGTLLEGYKFAPSLRVIPTVTLYAPDTGTSGAIRNASAGTDRTGATTLNAGTTGFSGVAISNASANPIALDDILRYHWVAEAEF